MSFVNENEFYNLVEEVNENEKKRNIEIKKVMILSVDFVRGKRQYDKNDGDWRFRNHNLVLGSFSQFDGKPYKVVTEKTYEMCSECKSEMMHDEQSDEYYCPICYTEDSSWLQKILKAVR